MHVNSHLHINVLVTDASVAVVVQSEAVLSRAVLYWRRLKRQCSECLRCMLIQVDAENFMFLGVYKCSFSVL